MNKYFFTILINSIFCFGIESISIPHNALELASSNSGIANSKNIGFNFANISNVKNAFNISSISWYQDVKGGNMEYKWGKNNNHYLNLFNLSAEDIDLRYLTPSEEPNDVFNIHHISIAYGYGKIIDNKISLGLKTSIIYNQLYTDESIGYNLDLGMSYNYNSLLSLGLAINQIGFEKINNSNINYPIQIGAGLSLNIKSLNTSIYNDIIYNEALSKKFEWNFSSTTKVSYLNIITGYNHSNTKSQFSCGLSFEHRNFEFNYGVAFHKALGTPIIVSLKYHI